MEPSIQFNPESVSILTYNLLYPQFPGAHADPRSNAVGYRYNQHSKTVVENSDIRMGVAIGNIKKNLTDVICLQEVTPLNFERLKKRLGVAYAALFQPHSQRTTHGVAIFYRFPQFIHLQIHSKTYPGHPQRTHIILDLLAVNVQKVMRIANCHLIDPRGMRNEHKAAQISDILEMMKPQFVPYTISAYVIAGDFNQDQWGDAPKMGKIKNKPLKPDVRYATLFQPLLKTGYVTDQDYSPSEYKRKRPENKKRDPSDPQLYSNKVVPRKRRIDYIWVRTQTPESIKPIPLQNINFSASDHAPVGSTFNL